MRRTNAKQRRGAMMVTIAVLMVCFMATVAFSIDIAHMHLARMELRAATDAAAKATSEAFARTHETSDAIAQGKRFAAANRVFNQPLRLSNSDFVFGRSILTRVDGAFDFTPRQQRFNSVRVRGERSGSSLSGPVPLFFGKFWGLEEFEITSDATATFLRRDVVIVIDRSGSMLGTRIADLTDALVVFGVTIELSPTEERVGLASYAGSATEDVQLTEDIVEFAEGALAIRPAGATNISSGIDAGRAIINRGKDKPFTERLLILMTDGNNTVGPSPTAAARRAARDKIMIHTITFGAGAGQSAMRRVAEITSGRHFHASSGERLIEIYREIALSLHTILTE